MKFFKFTEKTLSIIVFIELIIIIAMGTLIGLEKWQMYKASKKKYTPPTMTVEAKPVRTTDFETFITAVGTIKAAESVVIRSQDGGVIKDIYFQSGHEVEKNTTLIQFDDSVIKGQLEEAKARLLGAKTEYDREEQLLKRNATPKMKRDKAFAEYKLAQAQVATFEAKLKQTTIRAPFSGVIGLKDVSVGAYIKPGEEIVRLDDLDPVKIDFRISEVHLDKVSVGQTVTVEVDGFPDNLYDATIEAIDPAVDEAGHSIRVRASMANPGRELKPGLFARVRFSGSIHEGAMVVPEASVETEGNEEYVYAIIEGQARRIPVKTGGRNGTDVEIRSGLRSGVMVVTAGQLRIGDGTPVIVVPEKKTSQYKK